MHDAARRLQRQRLSDGTRFTFAYDAVGNRTTTVDAAGTTAWSYDGLHRMSVGTDSAGKRITYAYL